MKALIIGYGEMGHAFEHLLAPSVSPEIWYRHLDDADACLEKWAADATHVFFCLPATGLAIMSERIAAMLQPGCVCTCIAKGLDDQGRLPMNILQDNLAGVAGYGVIYGPMISEEIVDNKPAYAHVAASSSKHQQAIMQCFRGTGLVLQPHDDMIGLSWAAIMKNVYALLFGLADGLELGDNIRGALAVATTTEMQAILAFKEGKPGSAWSLGGLGDLITTATSSGSHHHDLGMALALGAERPQTLAGEGPHTISLIRQKQLLPLEKFPLARLVSELLADASKNPRDLLLAALK